MPAIDTKDVVLRDKIYKILWEHQNDSFKYFNELTAKGITREDCIQGMVDSRNESLERIMQLIMADRRKVTESEKTFDDHLRSYLPHDDKWRSVTFNVKINSASNLGFEAPGSSKVIEPSELDGGAQYA